MKEPIAMMLEHPVATCFILFLIALCIEQVFSGLAEMIHGPRQKCDCHEREDDNRMAD